MKGKKRLNRAAPDVSVHDSELARSICINKICVGSEDQTQDININLLPFIIALCLYEKMSLFVGNKH